MKKIPRVSDLLIIQQPRKELNGHSSPPLARPPACLVPIPKLPGSLNSNHLLFLLLLLPDRHGRRSPPLPFPLPGRSCRPLPFPLPLRRRRVPCFFACGSPETLAFGSRRENGESRAVSPACGVKGAEGGDLKAWLHAHGLPPCKVFLKESPSHGGKHRPIHYVASREDLQAGDVTFSVPNSLVVTLDRVLGNETVAELLTTNKLSELACLALYLMYEKKQGKKSFWYPFIRELDRQRGRGHLAVESPLLWSEAELANLDGSPTKAEVLERDEGIKREYNELDTVWFMAGSLFKKYPFDIPTEAFPFEIFKQAFVAVQSCVVPLQVYAGREKEALSEMIPYLRLSYVSDPAEMQSVISSEGPICPLANQNLDSKKRVAVQLVKLEKKILHACLEATAELINQLPYQTVSPCPAPFAPLLK